MGNNGEAAQLSREELLAKQARLKYVCDSEAGFRRRGCGQGFVYVRETGTRLRSKQHLARIENLVIPPAWSDVWICQLANGHLQATGRDAKERKQYIYHLRWREASDQQKFVRLAGFGELLPRIRRRVSRDLRRPAWSIPKLAALAVRLLDRCALRIGNREYARDNDSYGLTTLQARHVRIDGARVVFNFAGKSGMRQRAAFVDRQAAALLLDLRKQRTPTLLSYRHEGEIVTLHPPAVNDYLQRIAGEDISSKYFRTWKASVVVTSRLAEGIGSSRSRRRVQHDAVRAAAEALGNTLAVCRKHYIHSCLLDGALEARVDEAIAQFRPGRIRGLRTDEQRLLHVLKTVSAEDASEQNSN